MADTLLNEVMYNEVLTSDGYVVDFAFYAWNYE